MLTKDLGNTFSVINTYIVPQDNSIVDYTNFKEWFIKIWIKKDKILDNILTGSDGYKFTKIKSNMKTSNYLLLIFIMSLFIYLIFRTKGLFIPISLAIMYVITLVKYKMI